MRIGPGSLFLVAAGVLLAPTARAQVPHWLAGPYKLAASAARNPDVAVGGGVTHIVYRIESGGVGHISGTDSGQPSGELLLPGSKNTAAVTRSWNFPVVAVDASGVAHVAWGPQSSATGLSGTWYGRVDAQGSSLGPATQVSTRQVEDVAIGAVGQRVHIVTNAIAPTAGCYDHVRKTDGSAVGELLVRNAAVFNELSLAHTPAGGLSAIAQYGTLKHIEFDPAKSSWTGFHSHALPPAPITSLGRPRIAWDGATPLLSAVAWEGTTPAWIDVAEPTEPQYAVTYTQLSSAQLFDPAPADGDSPFVGLAVDTLGERGVAWLAASGARLRVAIGKHSWGTGTALPGTAAATTFAMCADGDAFRVVFTTDTGALYTGRVALHDPPDAGATDAGADGSAKDGTAEAARDAAPDSGASDATLDGAPPDAARGGTSADAGGCACRAASRDSDGGAAASLLLLFALLDRRARR